jgi:hypothetical protein
MVYVSVDNFISFGPTKKKNNNCRLEFLCGEINLYLGDKETKTNATNSVLLKFWGFTGLASLLASVMFPAVDSGVFVNPQISEARCVSGKRNKQHSK